MRAHNPFLVPQLIVAAVVAAILVAAACAPLGPVAGSDPEESALSGRMHAHFAHAAALRDAAISGDRAAVAPAVAWLADEAQLAGAPPGWRPHVEAMQDAARRAGDSDDATALGIAVADVAASCGACHAAHRVAVEVVAPRPPIDHRDLESAMARHAWAADRLWEGLVGPSEAAWSDGIIALTDAPLGADALPGAEREADPELADLALLVTDLAAEGEGVTDPNERARLYGRFLATCAACHDATGVAPRR